MDTLGIASKENKIKFNKILFNCIDFKMKVNKSGKCCVLK